MTTESTTIDLEADYNWHKVFWVAFVFAFGLVGLVYYILNPNLIASVIGIGYWYLRQLAITIGRHRYGTHQAFQMPEWLAKVWAAISTGTMQGTMLWWICWHLQHHARPDVSREDPHSPVDGFWHSFVGWFLKKGMEIAPKKYAKRILAGSNTRCRVIQWELRYHLPLTVVMCFGIPIAIGWGSGSFLHGLLLPCLLLGPQWLWAWWLNYKAHANGKPENFGGRISQIGTAGESPHGEHHDLQSHFEIGRQPGQLDPGARVIKWMAKVGMAWHLKGSEEYPLPG